MKRMLLPPSLAGRCVRLFVSLVGLALGAVAFGQSTEAGSISGKITDGSGTPLSGALVSVLGTTREVATERDGTYYLGNVAAGSQSVHVSYLGLPSKDFPVTVVAGQRTVFDGKLGEEVLKLATFQVEGTRAGQSRALNQQRSSENLKEVVAADAIGRFPDQNAAETLQRISSISLERDQGDGRFVAIRGLYADLNSTQMNGVNIPSSERGTRRVNLDSISSELIDGIELTKAVTPDMDADAIGGSINLKTKTAYSSDSRILEASGEGVYNAYSKYWGHKLGFTYGEQFNAGKWGVLLSLSDMDRKHAALDNEESTAFALKNGFMVPNGNIDIREYNVRRRRSGANLSFDFRPTKDDSFYVRGMYNHFADTEHRYRELFRNTAAATTPVDAAHGTVTGRPIQVDLKDRTETNNFYTISAGGDHQRGNIHIDYVASYSQAELVDPYRFEPVFQSGNTSWSYDLSGPYRPILTGAYQTAIAAGNFTVNSIRLRNALNQDTESMFAINVKGDTKWGSLDGYWKVGAKYRAREKTSTTDDKRYNASPAVNLGPFYRMSSFRSDAVNPFITINEVAFDRYFRDTPGSFTLNAITSAFGSKATNYDTNEDVASAYAMASVTSGNLTIMGGVRVEQTKFETTGWLITLPNTAAQTFTPVTVENDYTDVMPGIHARYRIGGGNRAQIRASFTQTLARPNYGDSSYSQVIDNSANTDTRGNPYLKPFSSDNFDLSFEYYPRKALGLFSVGVFYKNIEDFIFTQTQAGQGSGGTDLVMPLNGNASKMLGLEATWQQQFTSLPPPFDGFGVYTNLTLTDDDTDYGAARPNESVPFSRQSKEMANVALTYEKHGFFARVSLNYRSKYIEEGGIGTSAATDTYVDAHTQIDVSTNYRINKNFTVYAEVLNANQEPYIMHWSPDGGLLRKAEYYRFSLNAGLRYKF